MHSRPMLAIAHRSPAQLQGVRPLVEYDRFEPEFLEGHPAHEGTDADRNVAEVLPERHMIQRVS